MQKEKVNIAQGHPETRDNLNKFKSDYNVEHPGDKLKTLADAIDKLIEIATVEVPRLEELVSQRNAKIGNLEGKIEWMKPFMDGCSQRDGRIEELEKENEQLRMRIEELERS